MRRFLLMSVLAVGAANADIVPNLVGSGPVTCAFDIGLGSSVCTYEYTATLHSQTMVTGDDTDATDADFFTIYDFHGYVPGSALAPTDWEFREVSPDLEHINIGTKDDGAVPNLTFLYTGTADITDGRTISGFSAKSFFGPATVTDWYGSQAHKQGDTPGGVVQNVGPVQVPQPPQGEPGDVPEPMSMALLGGGLAALALLPRRFRKN